MQEFDFFETPITPYTVLSDQAEIEIHIRDTETMEQVGARLNIYGRLGERIHDKKTQKLDIEQSQGADEKFKESRYRKPKGE